MQSENRFLSAAVCERLNCILCLLLLQVVPPDDSSSERGDAHSVKSGGKDGGSLSGSEKHSSK